MITRADFRARLTAGPLVLDGAMGTMLHSQGIPIDQCFDAISRSNPGMVAEVHRAYIDAGADVIETNSFGANRFRLADHGLEQEVAAINRAAVSVARRVIYGSFKPVWLAGSVGPLGVRLAPLGRVRQAQAQAAFQEQIAALVYPEMADLTGVDLLILETMSDLKEVEAAVTAARAVSDDIPVVSLLTFTRDDRTLLGDTPAEMARKLTELDVDMIGVNCSGGPVQALRLLVTMREVNPDILLAAAPNAGWPQQMEGGRVLYPATPDYFADYARAFLAAGASLVGGCCGTTPAHIAAARQAVDQPQASTRPLPQVTAVRSKEGITAAADQPTRLQQDLRDGRFIVTVEMSPPRGINSQRLIAGARMLREAGAAYIDVADSPLARMRMSAWAAAYLVQKQVGVETILHFPTRGRSLLRIQGDLLAAYAMGVRNLFVVMGDPTHIGDYPEAMDNYDIVPTGLIQLIKTRLNAGVDQAGQSIDQPTNFVVGCALNLEPADPERELKLLRKKIANGADFALTQPVFNPARAREFIAAYETTYGEPIIPVIAGVQPLYSASNAEFLHNEVPGILIAESQRERMATAADQQQEGVRIAQEILLALRSSVQGVYLIPQFARYDLVADVMEILR